MHQNRYVLPILSTLIEASLNSVLVHQGAHRTSSVPSSTEMINPDTSSCSNEPTETEVEHRHSIAPFNHSDDGGTQSDSSNSTSTSSLASSPRYNERHPRAFENFRKSSSGSGRTYYGGGNCNSSTRGSFVVLGSRTSLPPLDENCPLDATESQLSLKLRRATRSSSWTNQKILDAIDGLNTSIEDLDPCLVLGDKASTSTGNTVATESNSNTESSRQGSFEKFVLPKSISNLIMKSRSSGSVNPPTSAQNRENSCYNFLSGIREDEDEEQHQDDTSGGIVATGIRLTIAPTATSSAAVEKCKNFIARGGESVKNCDDLISSISEEITETAFGRQSKSGNPPVKDDAVRKNILTQQQPELSPQDRTFSLGKVSTPHSSTPQTNASTDDVDKHHQLQLQQQQNSEKIMQSQFSNAASVVSDKGSKNGRPSSAQNVEQD